MPSKSSSSKTTTSATSEGSSDAPVPRKPAVKKVLSLIEEPAPKKKAGTTPRVASPLAPLKKTPAPPPAPVVPAKPAGPVKKTLAEMRKGALDLHDDENKPKAPRRAPLPEGTQSSALPPISLLRADAAAPPARAKIAFGSKPIEVVAPTPDQTPAPVEAAPAPVVPAVLEVNEAGQKIIHLRPPILVKDLADNMGLKAFKIISDLIAFKVFANADKAIDIEIAEKICEKHGFHLEREKREKGAGVHKVEEIFVEPIAIVEAEEPKDVMELRAPIITFMGHVDHGKTSLLDAIRKTSVTHGEAGGITQHIGAYSVMHEGRPITFIDTPGHAAFSGMRARGANVTDIVVLIVAADDGIMPQTKEALTHARAAKVQIMVALNKCDLPAADVMRVKGQLQEIGLAPVDWGGDIEVMEVSAKTGLGLDTLLDTMSLQAEVLELKSNPRAPARATVIESSMQSGKGPVATVIVRQGTLQVGTPFICGPYWGKVKALVNDRGEHIRSVRPGMPAEVIGFDDMPKVGDELVVMESERAVKKLSEERLNDIRQKKLASKPRRSTMESMFANISANEKKALKLVIRTDVQGSCEAITKCLNEIASDKISLDLLQVEPGAISESDILLASASDAIVIGFNTKVENKALTVSKREGVQVKLFSIIYELIDQVKDSLLGMLDPLLRERIIGHAKVKQVFKLTRGIVAGCGVIDGVLNRKACARVIRKGQAVFDGKMDTLRRFQDEVPEVRNGMECGVRLGGYTEYEEDDIIECYELDKVAQSL